MNKKAKIGIISAVSVVVIAAAVVVTLFLTGVFGGGKLGSLSSERFEIVGIDFVSMTQKGIHTYDLEVKLEDKFSNADDIKIYMSKNDTLDLDKSDELTYTKKEDGTYVINAVTYDAGDYFLYVTTGKEVGTYPLTVPKMAPKTWMNGNTVNIEFEVDGSTSWSSFIDPEGKNVYRSASPVFDETAKPMEENIDILTSSFADGAATKDEPYYYIVFNGKNGKFRYISAPLFYTATQGEAGVSFYEKKGKPYLEITGTLYAVSEDAERVMQLRVGNFDGDDPTSTFLVDNSYKGGDKTAFKFEVPLEKLKKASNNLALFLTENGTMCEWSINAANLDLSKYSLANGSARYGLTDENALKITRMIDAYESIKVSLGKSGKEAVLKVDGTHRYGIGGEDYQLVITATDGQQYVAENTVNDGKKFSFAFPLKQLYSAGIWYDIQIKCVNEIEYYDISTSAADMNQAVVIGEKKYNFEEYGGLLKIQYQTVKDFSGLKAVLTTTGGKPQLLVSGTIAKTKADNLALAIRTGDTVIESDNTKKADGQFAASIDLSQMKEKDAWYDVVILYKDANAYYDLTTSNADMKQRLESGKSLYTFQDWEGQLKVQYSNAPVKISNAKVKIETANGKAVLVVTGTAQENASSYKLGLRNEDNYAASVPNSAAGKKLLFKVDLSVLPKSATWYDIIIGHAGFGDSADLTTSATDMETSVTVGKRIYKFAEWEGQLKVYYDKVVKDLKNVKAEIVMKSGKPVMSVTGTMKNASSMYLGIRSDGKIEKVSNAGKGNNLSFIFDLTKLKAAGTWYDVIIGNKDFSSYKDVTVKSADMTKTVTYKKKEYKFAEWNRQLKVYFESDTAAGLAKGQQIKDVKTVLILKGGKPVLRVQGSTKGIENDNVLLGIRSEDKVTEAANVTKVKDRFLFDFDLTKLGKAGTWYDVIIIEKQSGAYVDVTTKAVYSMDVSVAYKDNVYRLADWEGDLKIYYTNTAEEEAEQAKVAANFTKVSAKIEATGNKPVLKVSANIGSLKNEDVTLNVRSGDTIIKVKNASKTAGIFEGTVDLTKITSKATWYDVYWFVESKDTELNLSAKDADMNSNYKYNGFTYQFKEWNSQLKVEFE